MERAVSPCDCLEVWSVQEAALHTEARTAAVEAVFDIGVLPAEELAVGIAERVVGTVVQAADTVAALGNVAGAAARNDSDKKGARYLSCAQAEHAPGVHDSPQAEYRRRTPGETCSQTCARKLAGTRPDSHIPSHIQAVHTPAEVAEDK